MIKIMCGYTEVLFRQLVINTLELAKHKKKIKKKKGGEKKTRRKRDKTVLSLHIMAHTNM